MKTAVDRIHTNALLYLGLTENLLEIERSKSDLLDERILKYYKPSDSLKQSILSQIVFNPYLVTASNEVRADWMDGYLIDQNFLSQVEVEKIDYHINDTIPSGALETMLYLKNSGHNLNSAIDACQRFDKLNNEHNSFFESIDKPIPDFQSEIDFILNHDYGLAKYTEEEISRKRKLEKELRTIRPILDCVTDYYQALNLSEKVNGTFYTGTPTDLKTNTTELKKNEIGLYKIIVEDIGSLPYRNTLKESLKLSQESETQAIRNQTKYWIHSIRTGKISEFSEIKREISKATESLRKREQLNSVGKFCTYVGVPLSGIGFLSPIAAIPGVIVTMVGAGSTMYAEYIEEKYEYAMFGNK